jgi:hypothetical protein
MNIKQIQKRQRFALVNQVLNENKTIVTTVPAFAKAAKLYADSLVELQTLAQRQVIGSQGKTAAKEAARIEMANAVMEVGSRIAAYAEAAGKVELEADVAVTRSAVLYGRAADGVVIAHRVLSLAHDNQAAMEAEYKLNTDLINDLAEKIDAFELILEAPAKAIDTRAVTTAGIEDAIAKTTRILTKQINRHMESLRRKHPDFAAAYDQANVLDKRRATRDKVEVSNSGEAEVASGAIAASAPMKIAATHEETEARYSSNGNGSHEMDSLEMAR